MARSAKLTSIDAVHEMAVALARFGDEARAAIDDLDINIRRAVEWIEQDRRQHWENEVRRGWERVGEARAELEKALTYRKVADRRPSCREERARLEIAKQRVRHAEEVYRALPGWAHRVERTVRDLTGAKTLLGDWVSSELPHALSVLKQMTLSLESYTAAQKTGGAKTPSTKTSTTEQSPSAETTSDTAPEKEPDDENMGSTHPDGETTPGVEGSQGV